MTKRGKIFIIILTVMVMAWLWLQTPLMAAARGMAWSNWVDTVGRIWKVGPLTVSNNVTEQVDSLVAENARLKAECRDYQEVMAQLGSREYEGFKKISARVAARPIDTYRAQLIINKGTDDGIVLGAPAVIQNSVVVGFINQLFEEAAVLQLLSSPHSTFPAEVVSEEATGKGLVQGKTFTSVEMITIPRDIGIKPGQEVVTAVQEGLVPYGLLIGYIGEAKDEQYEPYQRARLSLPYDADDLKAVTVLVEP